MRTTVDVDPALLDRAKGLALKERRTLGAVVSDALAAYLGSRKLAARDPPLDLIVRGQPSGRFPSPADMRAVEDEEDVASLGIPRAGRRAAP